MLIMANNITKGIKFTVDLPRDNPDGKSPMLDSAVWVERGTSEPGKGDRVRYTYYEKETSSPLVFHAHGAHTWRIKITTLANDTMRHMSNTDRFATVEERVAILEKFTTKMVDSGYDSKTRKEILQAGLKDYYRKVKKDITGTARLHRTAEEMKGHRSLKALQSKTWFGRRRGGQAQRQKKDNP